MKSKAGRAFLWGEKPKQNTKPHAITNPDFTHNTKSITKCKLTEIKKTIKIENIHTLQTGNSMSKFVLWN